MKSEDRSLAPQQRYASKEGKRLSSTSEEPHLQASVSSERPSSGRPPRPSSGDSRGNHQRSQSYQEAISANTNGGSRRTGLVPALPLAESLSVSCDGAQCMESPFQKQSHDTQRREAEWSIVGRRGSELDALAHSSMSVRLASNGNDISPDMTLRKAWTWLAEQPEDAAELAQLLYEATPRLGVSASGGSNSPTKGSSSPKKSLLASKLSKRASTAKGYLSLLDRLKAAESVSTGAGRFAWRDLTAVYPTELLGYDELPLEALADMQVAGTPSHGRNSSFGDKPPSPRGELVEVNSGGQVFFCFLRPLGSTRFAPERVLVIKFHSSRLATQSELFANELARHLGICSPCCRILRKQGTTAEEYGQLRVAAASLGASGIDLQDQVTELSSCLVMDYIPGGPLLKESEPFQSSKISQTASDLGRLFILDMLLGNPDRLVCQALHWRGNSENVRYCNSGPSCGRLVAIDAVVQRRPPGALVTQEDAHCNKVAELALNDLGYASMLLEEITRGAPLPQSVLEDKAACLSFQASLGKGLKAVMRVKGLLEMMFEVLSVSIAEFIEDIEGVEAAEGLAGNYSSPDKLRESPSGQSCPSPHSERSSPRQFNQAHTISGNRWGTVSPSLHDNETSRKLKIIGKEARQNQLISQRLDVWKAKMKKLGEELRAAVEDWQLKNSHPDFTTTLTTGFLDGTHPVVDAYELKVRLEHMLQRLRVLQDASQTGTPAQLLSHLYLSGAVEASSLHVLRHLGITQILNATEDLLIPNDSAGFRCLRCPIRDEEAVDITAHFKVASDFINSAQKKGEAVLVHCHEGKSRSVTLVLAYLMESQQWTLKEALEYVRVVRPQASPNTGFMAHLLKLEQTLHGKKSIAVSVKRAKPEPRVCPVCAEKVGLSAQSLAVHIRKHHADQ